MTQPIFSIIIPTYNSANTLVGCLESILWQSFLNYEVLIIDSVSTDETRSIVEHYSHLIPNISLISEKDDGIYDAMNKGVKMASADWIYFLGSDDSLFSNDTLLSVKKELEGFNVIYGNVARKCYAGPYDGEFTKEKIYHQNICHQAIFLNKRVFKVIGYFNQKYKCHADWDHNLKWFFSKKIKKKYVPLTIANFSEGGLSSTIKEPFFGDVKKWKYSVLTKESIGFKDKIKLIREEYHHAIFDKRRRDALKILLQIPRFLI